MKEIELCMKYDTCNRCPLNKKCEEEYKREMEQKSGECGEKEHNNRRKVWEMDGHRKSREQKKDDDVEMPL